jgi:hypothetical protein
MANLQNTLVDLLRRVTSVSPSPLLRPTSADVLGSPYADLIAECYERLGGVQKSPVIRPGHWDCELAGSAVELDEHLHFNRYRGETLKSPAYQGLPRFPKDEYLLFCNVHEDDCRKAGSYGGKWTNPSCEKQFGAAGAPGDLSGFGAARWKQRAFYDFVKDLSPLLGGTPVVRIAIWDVIEEGHGRRTVRDALAQPSHETPEALLDLIQRRTA